MKFFALLLLFAVMLLVTAMEDDKLKECEHCFHSEENLVCAKDGAGTFYNECEMECMGAQLLYDGPCKPEDLLDSRLEEK